MSSLSGAGRLPPEGMGCPIILGICPVFKLEIASYVPPLPGWGGLLCLYILNPRYIVQYICATLIITTTPQPDLSWAGRGTQNVLGERGIICMLEKGMISIPRGHSFPATYVIRMKLGENTELRIRPAAYPLPPAPPRK